VLDTYAIFSFLRRNPGGAWVRDLFRQARRGECELHTSRINLGEVAYWVEREEGEARMRHVLTRLLQLPFLPQDATWPRILAAAHVKAHHPVSYADAFAIALAQEMDASVVTGDPEFEHVEELIPVAWLPTK
jgi:ribonuclease VapC